MAILVKAIKPKRFRADGFRQALAAAARDVANGVEGDFKATTATWKHKVAFTKIVSIEPSPIEILVGTDDEIYRYVDEGTRPHLIFAKNAKVLAFPSAYSAKTAPRVIGSQAGGGSGPTLFRPYVEHPGTEARQFDQTIRDKWDPKFKRAMEQAMKAGAKASGHGI